MERINSFEDLKSIVGSKVIAKSSETKTNFAGTLKVYSDEKGNKPLGCYVIDSSMTKEIGFGPVDPTKDEIYKI